MTTILRDVIVSLVFSLIFIETHASFELSIIHMNDFHARYEEISEHASTCKAHSRQCIGGFSRVYHVASELKRARPNAIFLNAGDNFQGTVWYNVFNWEVTQYFMNLLPLDAMTLGNHEFDQAIEGVVPYLKALKAPVVVANIDARLEPEFGKYINKSVIVTRGLKRIGIVGAIVQDMKALAPTGKLKFTDEIEAIRNEARRLKIVDNCDIVIALTHCGLEKDKAIAKRAGPYLNVIVGGHSHDFLFHGENYPGVEPPIDDYPVVIEQDDGRKVLVVQASAFSRFLGNLTVIFDEFNEIESWQGNPIYLDSSIAQDPYVNGLLLDWKKKLTTDEVVATNKVDMFKPKCKYGECAIGNLVTDAMVYAWLNRTENTSTMWNYVSVAFVQAGGIRTGLEIGDVTKQDLIAVEPFDDYLFAYELNGQTIRDILEFAVCDDLTKRVHFKELLQVSGLQYVINVTRPAFSRIQSIEIRCHACVKPRFEPIRDDEYYRVTTTNYLFNGGNDYDMIATNARHVIVGEKINDIFTEYVARQKYLIGGEEERIRVVR